MTKDASHTAFYAGQAWARVHLARQRGEATVTLDAAAVEALALAAAKAVGVTLSEPEDLPGKMLGVY